MRRNPPRSWTRAQGSHTGGLGSLLCFLKDAEGQLAGFIAGEDEAPGRLSETPSFLILP